jgi:hypothetical protein
MRSLTVTILASVAALTLAAAPASAHMFPHGGGHGGWGGGHGWGGHGYWGGGAGLGFGIAAGVIGAGIAADAYCTTYAPIYDNYGNYIGQRPVNAC